MRNQILRVQLHAELRVQQMQENKIDLQCSGAAYKGRMGAFGFENDRKQQNRDICGLATIDGVPGGHAGCHEQCS